MIFPQTKPLISPNSFHTFFATNPSAYEIVSDENGYTDVDDLSKKLHAHNENINFEILKYIVDTSKKRFAFNDNL